MKVKKDCFAFNEKCNTCKAINVLDCKNCKFYKNKQEYLKECNKKVRRVKHG